MADQLLAHGTEQRQRRKQRLSGAQCVDKRRNSFAVAECTRMNVPYGVVIFGRFLPDHELNASIKFVASSHGRHASRATIGWRRDLTQVVHHRAKRLPRSVAPLDALRSVPVALLASLITLANFSASGPVDDSLDPLEQPLEHDDTVLGTGGCPALRGPPSQAMVCRKLRT